MSKRHYRQFIMDWKNLRTRCLESRLTIYGNEAPDYVKEAFALWIVGWYDTFSQTWEELSEFGLPYLDRHYKVCQRKIDLLRFSKMFNLTEDLAITLSAAKAADEMIVHYWTDPAMIRSRPSIELLAGESDTLLRLLGSVYPLVAVCLSGSSPTWHHAIIRTSLLFLSRLNYVTDEQKDTQIRDWIRVQNELTSDIPEIVETTMLKKIRSVDLSDRLVFQHGDGAVAPDLLGVVPRTLHDKYMFAEWTPRLRYLDRRIDFRPPFGKEVDRPVPSDLRFVPKQLGKYRVICMEPCANLYTQKGIQNALYEWFGSDRYLTRRIPITRAEQNTRLAREGSVTGDLVTIDLSHASDSVSWDLVKAWFKGSDLLRYLWLSRSPSTVLEHKPFVPVDECSEIKIRSYASMGNATTFPVECLVFCLACEHVITTEGGSPSRSRYSVYGDDIIIEREYALPLCWFLEDCGFEVNWEKSFLTSSLHSFRESCGGHYLDGTDVTPIRISRRFKGVTPDTPQKRSGLIDLANSLLFCWPHAREAVIVQLLSPIKGSKRTGGRKSVLVPRFVTWNSSDSAGLKSFEPSNYTSSSLARFATCRLGFQKFNESQLSRAYQTKYKAFWAPTLKVDYLTGLDKDEVALYEWLRASNDRVDLSNGPIEVHACPFRMSEQVRNGWRFAPSDPRWMGEDHLK